MDNSVYQPLSHALNPPATDARPTYSHPVDVQNAVDHPDNEPHPEHGPRHEEEEEEEEVEGAVVASAGPEKLIHANQESASPAPQKRRPGRPKGSKNKKPRFEIAGSNKQHFVSAPVYSYAQHQPVPASAPAVAQPSTIPSQPTTGPYVASDPSNQAFYDFQWRVLSLCSEFYNAADELIRNTPEHILHQCFSLPGNQVDPITLLHEARKACDQLMANPAAVVLKVPPNPAGQYPPPPTTGAKTASTSGPVIMNPGSFVVPLGGGTAQPQQQGSYNNASGTYQSPARYPTATEPYYAYSTQPSTGTHPYLAQQQVMKPVNLSTPSAAGNQGAWSEEETEKLKQLAEESKTAGQAAEKGDYDWDWVTNTWGPGRTRHQILIKATNMGMKESSSRATKKRRGNEPGHGTPDAPNNGAIHHSPDMNGAANATAQAVLNAVAAAASSSTSPPNDRPASSSVSPVQVHPQQPTLPPAPPGGGSLMHWPVPSPSPVVSSGTIGSRSVYYPRDRNGSKT